LNAWNKIINIENKEGNRSTEGTVSIVTQLNIFQNWKRSGSNKCPSTFR